MNQDKLDGIIKNLENVALKDQKYLSYFSGHKNRYKSDLQIFEKYYTEGETLEIGSLPCHLTYCLKKLGYSVLGIDINPERAADFIKRHNLNIIKCNIENEILPFGDNRFCLILLNEVFEHLRINPIFTLREIHRVLKPKGKLILTTPNLYSLENIVSYFLGRGLAANPYNEFEKLQKYGHMGHIREYSNREVTYFLKKIGFQTIKVIYKSYNKSRKGSLVDLTYSIIPFWRPYQIIISKK